MSPTGIFATENALTPEGGDIQRNLIFMTDGIDGDPCDYGAYGAPFYDKRKSARSSAPLRIAVRTGRP